MKSLCLTDLCVCQVKGSEPSSTPVAWDPMREVQLLAGIMQKGSEQPMGDKLSLFEIIGRGGFGCVYRGRWRNMDVAVKVCAYAVI